MFLPDKNYIILADTMHTSYRKVSNGQKVDGLDLSFKTSKLVTFSEWSPAFSRKFSIATWKIIEFSAQLFSFQTYKCNYSFCMKFITLKSEES